MLRSITNGIARIQILKLRHPLQIRAKTRNITLYRHRLFKSTPTTKQQRSLLMSTQRATKTPVFSYLISCSFQNLTRSAAKSSSTPFTTTTHYKRTNRKHYPLPIRSPFAHGTKTTCCCESASTATYQWNWIGHNSTWSF